MSLLALAHLAKVIGACKMSAIRLQKHFYSVPSDLRGLVIKTKYLGPTDHKRSRVKAIFKRDHETTWTKTINWNDSLECPDNHFEAALELIKSWDFAEYHSDMKIQSMGWDHDFYYFVVV